MQRYLLPEVSNACKHLGSCHGAAQASQCCVTIGLIKLRECSQPHSFLTRRQSLALASKLLGLLIQFAEFLSKCKTFVDWRPVYAMKTTDLQRPSERAPHDWQPGHPPVAIMRWVILPKRKATGCFLCRAFSPAWRSRFSACR